MASTSPLAAMAAIAVTSLAAVPSPAAAGTAFAGSCHLAGRVAFSPPLTTVPRAVANRAESAGRCSGALVTASGQRRALHGSRATFSATNRGDGVSCLGGTQRGNGLLALPGGKVRFRYREQRVTGVAALTFQGTAGGSALGVVTTLQENPLSQLRACTTTGLAKTRVTLEIVTTPRIAG